MGIFFNGAPKRVTASEMRDIMSSFYGKLDEKERVEVEKLFRGDLLEAGKEAGITRPEFDAAMQWLEENPRKHVLDDDDIALITRYFEEHLQD